MDCPRSISRPIKLIDSALAAAFAVFAVAGPVLADTPEGWDSWPEAQPFRVGLRVTGFFTLVFLILFFSAIRVAGAFRTRKRAARSRE
jgi:hypothetical protein